MIVIQITTVVASRSGIRQDGEAALLAGEAQYVIDGLNIMCLQFPDKVRQNTDFFRSEQGLLSHAGMVAAVVETVNARTRGIGSGAGHQLAQRGTKRLRGFKPSSNDVIAAWEDGSTISFPSGNEPFSRDPGVRKILPQTYR
jgi:hypothetical protein